MCQTKLCFQNIEYCNFYEREACERFPCIYLFFIIIPSYILITNNFLLIGLSLMIRYNDAILKNNIANDTCYRKPDQAVVSIHVLIFIRSITRFFFYIITFSRNKKQNKLYFLSCNFSLYTFVFVSLSLSLSLYISLFLTYTHTFLFTFCFYFYTLFYTKMFNID